MLLVTQPHDLTVLCENNLMTSQCITCTTHWPHNLATSGLALACTTTTAAVHSRVYCTTRATVGVSPRLILADEPSCTAVFVIEDDSNLCCVAVQGFKDPLVLISAFRRSVHRDGPRGGVSKIVYNIGEGAEPSRIIFSPVYGIYACCYMCRMDT